MASSIKTEALKLPHKYLMKAKREEEEKENLKILVIFCFQINIGKVQHYKYTELYKNCNAIT